MSKLDYNKIKNLAAAKRIPIKELARRCDLSEQGFHYMLKKQTMRVDTLERICETLEITMVDLFEDNMDASHVLGAIQSANPGSYTGLIGKLDTIIELLRVEKYAKMD
ncbi:MAG: helix-turn-helix transcriptional regulator [Sphingomonadales bacterium]|nr:helix-turn-helix transcriptional regulator [Sphingomonadales bacterium]